MELHFALLTLGGLLLLGLAADAVGRRTRIPRVTLLILLGVVLGKPGLGLIPEPVEDWYEPVAVAALSMVAFALGGSLTGKTMRAHGAQILTVSIAVVAASVALVTFGLLAIGVPLPLALLLGGIATATAPAATRDVVRQSGVDNDFNRRLLGIVAIDDAWGLIAFGVLLVFARATLGEGTGDVLPMTGRELGGALVIGAIVGIPAAYLTGRLRPGEATLIEVLGVVFLCAGLAIWLEVSFLLAGMVAGALVANLARHHERPFHEIDNVQAPFLILFFVLAGALVELPDLQKVLPVCIAYVFLRVAGRVIGGLVGGGLSGLPMRDGFWTGAALSPQAGVALGMALVASDHLPEYSETILAVTVATTVFFEIAGPLLTQAAIARHHRPTVRSSGQ